MTRLRRLGRHIREAIGALPDHARDPDVQVVVVIIIISIGTGYLVGKGSL